LAVLAALSFSGIAFGFSTLAPAQTSPDAVSASDNCSSVALDKAFTVRRGQEIISRFFARPAATAEPAQIRAQLTNLLILGKFATQGYNASSSQCDLGPRLDERSLSMDFVLLSIRPNAPKLSRACVLTRCANELSEFLQSTAVDTSAFSRAIDAIEKDMHQVDSVNPFLNAARTAEKAYRHIYSPNSIEWLYIGLIYQDYRTVEIDAFASWFSVQQTSRPIQSD
jgi:hypothetical protein